MAIVIILFGAVLIAGGAYGIFSGYADEEAVRAGIGWGAIIIGALTTLFGFGKRVSERTEETDDEVSDHAHAEIRAMVQAMGVVAVADNKVRDTEVEAIARVHEQMLGIKISHNEVREILSEFGPSFDITKRLMRDRSKISPAMKRLILQSCHLVMVSDMEVVKPEENRVQEIGIALGFDPDEIEDLIASAGT